MNVIMPGTPVKYWVSIADKNYGRGAAYGYFQAWSEEYEEFEQGVGNYTVAIILTDEKKIKLVLAELVEID